MPKMSVPETSEVNATSSECPKNDQGLNTNDNDDQRRKPTFLFSIDYILNKAGETDAKEDTKIQNSHEFEWLSCTRFKPPKLQRTKRNDGKPRQKRRPGRNPRIPFTMQQVTILEQEFHRSAYLGGVNDVHILAERLRLSENRIKIWFQNRRARERRDFQSSLVPGPSSSIKIPIQQKPLPISLSSAFKPLPPVHTYVVRHDPSSKR